MADNEAKIIEERNRKYLEGLNGNLGKYLTFLSTMARFHKYEVSDLASFALEAPAMFTAVADKELWEKHFQRKISSNARGITLIRDGQKKIYYDVSETTAASKNSLEVKLWQYDEAEHKKFLDAVVAGENSTENQIRIIATELANRTNADEAAEKIIALSVETVILERMGYTTDEAARQLAQLSLKERNLSQILDETQKSARIFLDAMQKAIAQKRITLENVSAPENNPLVKELGVIHSESAAPKIEVEEVSVGAGNSSLEAEEIPTSEAEKNHGTAVEAEVFYDPSIPTEEPAPAERGNPEYDFEEMDEEEEILLENQVSREAEIDAPPVVPEAQKNQNEPGIQQSENERTELKTSAATVPSGSCR